MDKPLAMPDISVIIASYNVQGYIERAVRSALDQKGVQVEVILVDDLSTDETVAVASRIADPRLTILRRAVNGGPGAARNEGIAAATGAWVAILDGDDAFAPGRLMNCLQRAREMKADIVVDHVEARREADKSAYPLFPAAAFEGRSLLDLATFIRGNAFLWSRYSLGYLKPIFSKAFLRQHKLSYDAEIRIGEDYMLLAEALACGGRCAVKKKAGYFYTVRAGSISHRLSPADILRIQEGDRRFAKRHKLDPEAQKAQLWREFTLRDVLSYAELVDALKEKRLKDALRIFAARPGAALHLWEPVYVRIKCLFGSRIK